MTEDLQQFERDWLEFIEENPHMLEHVRYIPRSADEEPEMGIDAGALYGFVTWMIRKGRGNTQHLLDLKKFFDEARDR